MAKRTVEINLSEEFNAEIDRRAIPLRVIDTAIGYLSRWAIESGDYNQLKIWGDRDGNLTAHYAGATVGSFTVGRAYAIHAQLSGEGATASYSFHS